MIQVETGRDKRWNHLGTGTATILNKGGKRVATCSGCFSPYSLDTRQSCGPDSFSNGRCGWKWGLCLLAIVVCGSMMERWSLLCISSDTHT